MFAGSSWREIVEKAVLLVSRELIVVDVVVFVGSLFVYLDWIGRGRIG